MRRTAYLEQRLSIGLLKIEDGKDYLQYISSYGCLVCGQPNPDRDHLETVGMGGNRKRYMWEDFTCIPLCRMHHTERHTNMKKFEDKYRINLWKEQSRLLRRWLRYEQGKE